jgi:hypothetical protein
MGFGNKGATEGNGCDEKQKEQCKLQFGKYVDWACEQCADMKKKGAIESD